MPTLPVFSSATNTNDSPHVVILGAGASLAACPKGDRHGRQLPLMANLIETLALGQPLRQASVNFSDTSNFEEVYQRIAHDSAHDGLRLEIERRLQNYFSALEIPDEVTVYDELLLSLRGKDLVASFNWDPLLLQAYARSRNFDLPGVVFLHGNVYLGHCPAHKAKGYSTQDCNACGNPFEPSPLLFPIKSKNYEAHPLIASEWRTVTSFLERAYIVTIFGYAAPSSDVAAREMLLKAWSTNGSRELAIVEVIDTADRDQLCSRWREFAGHHDIGVLRSLEDSYQHHYPRRSCEAYASASLQQDPWSERRLPRLSSLRELQKWFQPLVDEERAFKTGGIPFRPFRRDDVSQV